MGWYLRPYGSREGSYHPCLDTEKGNPCENSSGGYTRDTTHALYARESSPPLQEWQGETKEKQTWLVLHPTDL